MESRNNISLGDNNISNNSCFNLILGVNCLLMVKIILLLEKILFAAVITT